MTGEFLAVKAASSAEERFERWVSGDGVETTELLSVAIESSLTADGLERCGHVAEVR